MLMKTTLFILGATVIMFSLTEFLHLHVEIHALAMAGAGIALIAAKPEDNEMPGHGLMHAVSEKVEWHALLFFAGLFILVGAMGNVGYLSDLANWIFDNFGSSHVMLAVAIIWVSAIASAIIDNIPFTTAMIPVIEQISKAGIGVPLRPMVWALAFGACLGGNGTLIGASANVVMVGLAEQEGITITFNQFFVLGFPIMIGSVIIANIYLVLCHIAGDWE